MAQEIPVTLKVYVYPRFRVNSEKYTFRATGEKVHIIQVQRKHRARWEDTCGEDSEETYFFDRQTAQELCDALNASPTDPMTHQDPASRS